MNDFDLRCNIRAAEQEASRLGRQYQRIQKRLGLPQRGGFGEADIVLVAQSQKQTLYPWPKSALGYRVWQASGWPILDWFRRIRPAETVGFQICPYLWKPNRRHVLAQGFARTHQRKGTFDVQAHVIFLGEQHAALYECTQSADYAIAAWKSGDWCRTWISYPDRKVGYEIWPFLASKKGVHLG